MNVITYIHFPGQAEEAINFYKETLGAELVLITYMGDGPKEVMEVPEHLKKKIMHARVMICETVVYISDTFDDSKINKGNNVALSIHVNEPGEVDAMFAKLSAGGEATMPPSDAFWGSRFSMLTDKFGIH